MSEVLEHELQEADLPREDRTIARDVGLNVVARMFAMACSSVTALLVANALTRSEYGAYAIVVGINVVLVMGLDVGMTSSLARFVAQGRATTRLVVTVAFARLGLIGAAALVVLAGPFVERGTALEPLLPALALLIVAQSLIAFHFGALPSLRRIRLLLLVTVLQPAGELALVLYARSRDGGPEEMLLATAASALVVSALAWLVLLTSGRAAAREVPEAPAGERATFDLVWRYGLQLFLVSLLIAVFGQVDQFVIGIFHPLAEVAPYALAIKLQVLVSALAITIAGIVAPRIAGAGVGAYRLYRQWLGFLVAIGIGEVLVLAMLSGEAFGAIGSQYRDDSNLLWAMVPFLLLSTVAPLPSIALNQTGHAASRLRIAGTAVAVNLVLDLLLVPWMGAWGAVIATTIAYLIYFVRHHLLLQRALTAGAHDPSPRLDGLVIRAFLVGVLAAVLAAGVRAALHAMGEPSDLVVLLIAGAVAALPVLWFASRVVRGSAVALAR